MNLLTIHLLCTAPKPSPTAAPRIPAHAHWFRIFHR